MSLIIIEGPEKSGKSTLANAIKDFLGGQIGGVVVRHQIGRAKPDDSVYLPQLVKDTSNTPLESIAIWDRGWPSEYVYGSLLDQDRRLAQDPWLGEWEYGRRVAANGLRVMLPGPHYAVLSKLRTPDDLPVNCAAEQMLYLSYAVRFGWLILEQAPLDLMVRRVMANFMLNNLNSRNSVQNYLGDPLAKIIIVCGESHEMTAKNGRLLGDMAIHVGWVTAHECSPVMLRQAEVLVTCGKKAYSWVRDYVQEKGGNQQVIQLPAISFLSQTVANYFQTNNKGV